MRHHVSLSIIGMCKNAGKTTVLNALLDDFSTEGTPLGLTSIGRDGEARDLATGTGKPGIYVCAGTLLATAAGLLPLCDITREILDTTGISTPLGEVVVLRALSGGHVQVAGPSIVSQLETVSALMRQHGAQRIVIDGAISRKSLATRSLSGATVLCTGASCGAGMAAIVEEAAYFCHLAALPAVQGPALPAAAALAEGHEACKAVLVGRKNIPLEDNSASALADGLSEHKDNGTTHLFLPGALTDGILKPLVMGAAPLKGLALVVRDASRLLMTRGSYQKLLAKGGRLEVLESLNLVAVTVNPFSAYGNHLDGAAFLAAMQKAVEVPVFNILEEGGGEA